MQASFKATGVAREATEVVLNAANTETKAKTPLDCKRHEASSESTSTQQVVPKNKVDSFHG